MIALAPDLPPAHIPYGNARLGVLVARRTWPDNPCNGHEQVLQTGTPPAWAARAPIAAGASFAGAADLAGKRCLIWINAHFDRTETCKAIVHEAGHWDDQDHTPTGPMAEWIDDDDFAPCEPPIPHPDPAPRR